MKSEDFGSVLKAYAEMLGSAGAPASRAQITTFAAIFDVDSKSTVSSLAKRVSSSQMSETGGSPNLGDVVRLLLALKGFLRKSAKAASLLADITVIENILQDRASMGIDAFTRAACEVLKPSPKGKRGAPAVQNGLVLQYKERLEATLGDEDKFSAVMSELRANQDMGKSEIIALAKEMTGSGARAIDAALKKIWSRHQALMVFKAKSRATRGRSAA